MAANVIILDGKNNEEIQKALSQAQVGDTVELSVKARLDFSKPDGEIQMTVLEVSLDESWGDEEGKVEPMDAGAVGEEE